MSMSYTVCLNVYAYPSCAEVGVCHLLIPKPST